MAMTGDVNERLRVAFFDSIGRDQRTDEVWSAFQRELAAQGLAVVEVSQQDQNTDNAIETSPSQQLVSRVEIGEPSEGVGSPDTLADSHPMRQCDNDYRNRQPADASSVSADLTHPADVLKNQPNANMSADYHEKPNPIDKTSCVSPAIHNDLRDQVARILMENIAWPEDLSCYLVDADRILALVQKPILAEGECDAEWFNITTARLRGERDAARATLAALTSDAAVEAAWSAYVAEDQDGEPVMRAVIAAAIASAEKGILNRV